MDKKNNDTQVQQNHNNEGTKQDLEMNRNKNERANENVNKNSFEEDKSEHDVGSEITDGGAG